MLKVWIVILFGFCSAASVEAVNEEDASRIAREMVRSLYGSEQREAVATRGECTGARYCEKVGCGVGRAFSACVFSGRGSRARRVLSAD